MRTNKDRPGRPDLLLTNFGLARFLSADSQASQTIRGTPNYMPPEQWAGKPVPATDQYALAVIDYLLLTGRLPFQGDPQQLMHMHLTARPQPPSTLNRRVPPALDAVILRVLTKRPEDRYPSVSAFAQALQEALLVPKSVASATAVPAVAGAGGEGSAVAVRSLESVSITAQPQAEKAPIVLSPRNASIIWYALLTFLLTCAIGIVLGAAGLLNKNFTGIAASLNGLIVLTVTLFPSIRDFVSKDFFAELLKKAKHLRVFIASISTVIVLIGLLLILFPGSPG